MEDSMKKALSYVFIAIIGFFFLICGLLEFIVIPSKTITNIGNSDWITITVTYFAGTMGGLIAFGGIAWQLNHEKKGKKKRLNNYIDFILKENLSKVKKKDSIIRKLLTIEGSINYSTTLMDNRDISYKLLEEFDPNYMNENIDNILMLSNGEKILKLSKKIILFNRLSKEQLENFQKKNKLRNSFSKLREECGLIKNKEKEKLYMIFYSLHSFCNFTSNISFGLVIKKSKLPSANVDKDIYTKIKSLIDISKENKKITEIAALEKITEINKELLEITLLKLYELSYYKELNEVLVVEAPHLQLTSEFIKSIEKDKVINGMALDMYNEFMELSKLRKLMD